MRTEDLEKLDLKIREWEYIDEYSDVESPYGDRPPFDMPIGDNHLLNLIKVRVERCTELSTLWKCSNVVAMDRLGYSDHGKRHMEIVANHALQLLRLLGEAGIKPSSMKDYNLSYDDAEVILFLAACLHDIGHSIHRDNHSWYSVSLAAPLLNKLLAGIYSYEKSTIVASEVLHCIAVHHRDNRPLTIEAGILRVSDALDMAHGRTRLWDDASSNSNIYAVSAKAIESVEVLKGKTKPVLIRITMSGSAGVFQIDELLRPKMKDSGIQEFIQIEARVECEKPIIEDFVI